LSHLWLEDCEKTLFGQHEPEGNDGDDDADQIIRKSNDKSQDDVFSTEKFMRLASHYDVRRMEKFFKDSN